MNAGQVVHQRHDAENRFGQSFYNIRVEVI